MEATITKQKDILDGNEAYLIGVDKLGQQVWLEVLNDTEIKCETIIKDNIDLNRIIEKKTFTESQGNYVNNLLYTYLSTHKFIKRHPEHKDYLTSVQFQILMKSIIDTFKPTIK